MAEEQEQSESAAFDENPPVDPSEPQVGNSKARFFVPRDEDEDGSGREAGSERDESGEGES
ncbi:MAG: hypothetical protein H0U12_09540 [Thermoleophilaceae bacterium]|jgi:hypothetical protein|nr:hypothetical protein [Thermoleophilaceae bacterium]